MFSAVSAFKQLIRNKNLHLKKASFPIHPTLIAYLLHSTFESGPHILISSQTQLLEDIKASLLFFEPERPVPFSFGPSSLTDLHPFAYSYQEAHALSLLSHTLFSANNTSVFLISPLQLAQKRVSPTSLKSNCILLKQGELLPSDFFSLLVEKGYKSQDQVEQIGEFSMRGAVLDIFCDISSAFRIELLGNQIQQIKTFDIKSQISSFTTFKQALIPPAREESLYLKSKTYQKIKNILKSRKKDFTLSFSEWKENIFSEKNKADFLNIWKASFLHNSSYTFLDYFSLKPPLIWNLDTQEPIKNHLKEIINSFKTKKLINPLGPHITDIYTPEIPRTKELIFDFLSPSPHFKHSHQQTANNLSDLITEIKKYKQSKNLVFLLIDKTQEESQIQQAFLNKDLKLKKQSSWFEMKQSQEADPLLLHLIQDFKSRPLIWPEGGLLFFDLRNYPLPKKKSLNTSSPLKKNLSKQDFKAKSLSFSTIQAGDLLVHRKHGIGLFKKLLFLNVENVTNEFLALEYKEKNILYVPVYALNQVHKYNTPFSIENHHLILDKLGDKSWNKKKEKINSRIQNMTLELMNLYQVRAYLKRSPFSLPGKDYKKFETDFPFQETPDQQKAIIEVLRDLTQSTQPADRLICGDTGFGKTEVAMRASFKVIEDGFQVCLIAPTTILSFQHFKRFKERFKKEAVSIHLLNRFTSLTQKKQIQQNVAKGKVDILIGTHRILNRDLHFKHLGLLIIDEEHLFGVKSKEKIKSWHSYVDTISLSATPIPRSLSMSLNGIRDMSLVLSPPLNRKAVKTAIHSFNKELIKTAVLKELQRQGQVIFIHNRIETIYELEKTLKKLLPQVRIRTAHGKMKNLQENIVLDFLEEKFDLLLCTTIVQSGMDFPKANTLFINKAEYFGLSQLHQLRGRVGRSDRQAFCYLLTSSEKKISDSALKRLKIIQENNKPGSGITIAQYDLEMRGAGDLMGKKQSGFIQEIGFELYFELLQENIKIAKISSDKKSLPPEPNLQFKQGLFIPSEYIPHDKIKLVFYKKIALCQSPQELKQLKQELTNFAGPLPLETSNLFLLSHIRLMAKTLHARELSYQQPWLYISFVESSPLSHLQIAKWAKQGFCHLHSQNTLKFFLEEENLQKIFNLLEKLIGSLKI